MTKRRFLFVPDVPYHVQATFVAAFAYIWLRAFYNDPDYLQPTPTEGEERYQIIHKNVWQSIYSIVVFMVTFSYLQPYIETTQNIWLQRAQRMAVTLMLCYFCWLIFMFNQRPDFGRETLGFLDRRLNKVITRGMHTYDDDCSFTISMIWSEMDHYYLVHWADWTLATFVLRDAYVLHFWHVFNEIIELSF